MIFPIYCSFLRLFYEIFITLPTCLIFRERLRRHLLKSYCKTEDGDESDTEGADVVVVGSSAAAASSASGRAGCVSAASTSGVGALPTGPRVLPERIIRAAKGSGDASRAVVSYAGVGHTVVGRLPVHRPDSAMAKGGAGMSRNPSARPFVAFSGAGHRVGSSSGASAGGGGGVQKNVHVATAFAYGVGAKRPRGTAPVQLPAAIDEEIIAVDDEGKKVAEKDTTQAVPPDAKRSRGNNFNGR